MFIVTLIFHDFIKLLIDMERRAREAIEFLTQQHRYDHAIKLAKLWDVSIVPIIHAFTTTCVNLLYDVAPPSGDPADYVRYLDVSGKSSIFDIPYDSKGCNLTSCISLSPLN